MTTTNKVKAWEIAHTMIDGLQYDTERTERGSGKTWSKPSTNATVIDLGVRLEVNKENGETVNIWIEPITDEDTVSSVTQPIIKENVQRLVFAVNGSDYNSEPEQRLYEKLGGDMANWVASDFVSAWCKNHNFKWGSISISNICHYAHGNNGGHYCITALITEPAEQEEE